MAQAKRCCCGGRSTSPLPADMLVDESQPVPGNTPQTRRKERGRAKMTVSLLYSAAREHVYGSARQRAMTVRGARERKASRPWASRRHTQQQENTRSRRWCRGSACKDEAETAETRAGAKRTGKKMAVKGIHFADRERVHSSATQKATTVRGASTRQESRLGANWRHTNKEVTLLQERVVTAARGGRPRKACARRWRFVWRRRSATIVAWTTTQHC